MKNKKTKKKKRFVGFLMAFIGVMSGWFWGNSLGVFVPVSAAETTMINVTLGEILNLGVSSPSMIEAIPGVAAMSETPAEATINSNLSSGYVLTMTAAGDGSLQQNPVVAGAAINSISGSDLALADFEANQWGYALKGVDSDGEEESGDYEFQAIPVDEGEVIEQSSGTAKGLKKRVYFGVKTGAGLASGTYTNTVTFTLTKKL